MPLSIGSIVLNVTDMQRATEFWTAALGYQIGHADWDFAVLKAPDRPWANLSLQLTDKPKAGLNRLHLDLYSNGNQAPEVARLEGLGATRIEWEYPPDADFVVLADPDGNEFCVI